MAPKKISAQKFVPLCAFFGTFTIVMTILVLSTDMRPRRRHLSNGSFEGEPIQVSVGGARADERLIRLIRERHLRPPPPAGAPPHPPPSPLPELAQLFGWKRGGVFVEVFAPGTDDTRSDTEWLETALQWRGLLVQPDPQAFAELLSRNRTRSHAANVCLGPDTAAALDQGVEGGVPCFPLYSLLLAYNATRVHLLSLHAKDPAQLQSVWWWVARVRVVSVACGGGGGGAGGVLVRLMRLLATHGYKLNRYASANGRWVFVCSRCR